MSDPKYTINIWPSDESGGCGCIVTSIGAAITMILIGFGIMVYLTQKPLPPKEHNERTQIQSR